MNKTVQIEGMMCNNCVKHVKEALKGFGGSIEVSLEEGTAFIKDATKTDKEIKEAIEELGFDVLEIKNER